MPLTFAESQFLQKEIDHAIANVQALFLQTMVVRSDRGIPLGGPDPRAVEAEVLLALARRIARAGLDLTGAAAFEAKIASLEAQLQLHELGTEITKRMVAP
jgi:hypothetical protein